MGADAKWKKPGDIKKYFYQKICEHLAKDMNRKVELVVEKDKLLPGPIHLSMYREATACEVYIADLTGNNPNVYLELGVRWALMDRVTVLVSQDVASIRFNAASSRAISYGLDPIELEQAIENVAATIQASLEAAATHSDSPVRQGQDIIAVDRSELKQLQSEIARLKHQQGEEAIRAAAAAKDDEVRLRLFRSAVEASPARVDFRIALAEQLQAMNQLTEAKDTLETATRLEDTNGDVWRQLGVTLGLMARKQKQPALLVPAVDALKKAVRLSPNDFEAHSNLGGALRRLAFVDYPESHAVDWSKIESAYESYQRATEINPHSTYARTNLAKLALMQSAKKPEMSLKAAEHYRKVKPLIEFSLEDLSPDDPDRIWKRFDHAESILGIGDIQAALRKYDEAIAETPSSRRASVAQSVLSPIIELLALGAGDATQKAAFEGVRSKLESALRP